MVGVSPSVIRSWESLGLARPQRTESKYRLYDAEDIKILKRARFLRKVRGLNAPAIVELLKREGKITNACQWIKQCYWNPTAPIANAAKAFTGASSRSRRHLAGFFERP